MLNENKDTPQNPPVTRRMFLKMLGATLASTILPSRGDKPYDQSATGKEHQKQVAEVEDWKNHVKELRKADKNILTPLVLGVVGQFVKEVPPLEDIMDNEEYQDRTRRIDPTYHIWSVFSVKTPASVRGDEKRLSVRKMDTLVAFDTTIANQDSPSERVIHQPTRSEWFLFEEQPAVELRDVKDGSIKIRLDGQKYRMPYNLPLLPDPEADKFRDWTELSDTQKVLALEEFKQDLTRDIFKLPADVKYLPDPHGTDMTIFGTLPTGLRFVVNASIASPRAIDIRFFSPKSTINQTMNDFEAAARANIEYLDQQNIKRLQQGLSILPATGELDRIREQLGIEKPEYPAPRVKPPKSTPA